MKLNVLLMILILLSASLAIFFGKEVYLALTLNSRLALWGIVALASIFAYLSINLKGATFKREIKFGFLVGIVALSLGLVYDFSFMIGLWTLAWSLALLCIGGYNAKTS